jgi:prefoldin subunit 5
MKRTAEELAEEVEILEKENKELRKYIKQLEAECTELAYLKREIDELTK